MRNCIQDFAKELQNRCVEFVNINTAFAQIKIKLIKNNKEQVAKQLKKASDFLTEAYASCDNGFNSITLDKTFSIVLNALVEIQKIELKERSNQELLKMKAILLGYIEKVQSLRWYFEQDLLDQAAKVDIKEVEEFFKAAYDYEYNRFANSKRGGCFG